MTNAIDAIDVNPDDIHVPSLREAQDLLKQVDALFTRAGLYESEQGFASAFSLQTLTEDLDIDIDRIENHDAY